MTSVDVVEHLLKRSEEFLRTAEYQTRRRFFGLAAFSLEQALCIHLKARLVERGVEYPRTHSIRRLLRMLSQVEDEGKRQQVRNLMDNYILELGILEDAYITSRYLLREFERGEIERLTLVVTKVLHDAR